MSFDLLIFPHLFYCGDCESEVGLHTVGLETWFISSKVEVVCPPGIIRDCLLVLILRMLFLFLLAIKGIEKKKVRMCVGMTKALQNLIGGHLITFIRRFE